MLLIMTKILNKKFLKQVFLILGGLKLLGALLYIISPETLPHTMRQIDTLGVSLRYFIRWTHEDFSFLSFLPAYLGSGDHYAIQFMEFPIINLISAPWFIFGFEWGRIFIKLQTFVIIIALNVFCYKKSKGLFLGKIELSEAFLLFPFISVISFFYYKQIPDVMAAMLVYASIINSYREDSNSKNFFYSFILLTLGALIKPPQVSGLFLLLLHPKKSHVIKSTKWILPALAIGASYYVFGGKFFSQFADGPNFFASQIRNPLTAFIGFISSPKDFLAFLNLSLFQSYVFIPVFIASLVELIKKKKSSYAKFSLVLLLQIIFVALLDGKHSYIHNYYFAGISLTCCLMFLTFLKESHLVLKVLAIMLVLSGNLSRTTYEAHSFFDENNIYSQCERLKKSTPEFPWEDNYVLNSRFSPPPVLGVCFGEREGSKTTAYGFGFKDEPLQDGCEIYKEDKTIVLTKCGQRL